MTWTLLRAGGQATTIATLSGSGKISVRATRDPNSAAPNIPTYLSMLCDGGSVYSGAFNTTGTHEVTVPYAGSTCRLIGRTAQPSQRWAGTTSTVWVTATDTAATTGTPAVVSAPWASRPVASSGQFTFPNADGITGHVTLKLTACSSSGGTTDATGANLCGGHVQRGIGSSFTVTITDQNGTLYSGTHEISAARHHDMVTLPTSRAVSGDVRVQLVRVSGSAVLVHGPGSRVVGTR